jgi:hypothetical protein
MSPFDSLTPLLCKWSAETFVDLFPFRSYSTFLFWFEIAHRAEVFRGFSKFKTP